MQRPATANNSVDADDQDDPRPQRLFQTQISGLHNPMHDIFDIPEAEAIPVHNPEPDIAPPIPNPDRAMPTSSNNAADVGSAQHHSPEAMPALACIIASVRHPAVAVHGRRGRDPHPDRPDLLWCTKQGHYISATVFGDKQQCSECWRKARERTVAHRARAQQVSAGEQIAQQLPEAPPIPSAEPEAIPQQDENIAVSPEEKQQLNIVREKLLEIQMEECMACHERWFDLDVKNGQCSKCRSCKNNKFTEENAMHPGDISPDLPALTQMEEMLIAPVHALVQLWQVHGGQYKYTGHTCKFSRENAILHAKVPLLPEDCDIIIMRCAGLDEITSEAIYQDFRVRRNVIQQWLIFLQANHPTFQSRQVTIDQNALDQLPVDGSVHNRLRTITVEELKNLPPDNVGPQQNNETDEPDDNNNPPMYSCGFVPNVNLGITELQQLQVAAGTGDQPIILTMPHVRGTPINEYSGRAIAIDAFPSLFPTGQADFTATRDKEVTMTEWAAHLLRFKDGRFARHPRFRYWALNTIL